MPDTRPADEGDERRLAPFPIPPRPSETSWVEQSIRDGRLRAETYPGEWADLRKAARRRRVRRGIAGWAAAIAMLSVSACTTTVALTAGGLVGYAGYSIYRLAEAGRSWTAAATEFLFTSRKAAEPPAGEAGKAPTVACSWGDRLRLRC